MEYVQPVAGSPYKIEREMTEVYGVGAFLLVDIDLHFQQIGGSFACHSFLR